MQNRNEKMDETGVKPQLKSVTTRKTRLKLSQRVNTHESHFSFQRTHGRSCNSGFSQALHLFTNEPTQKNRKKTRKALSFLIKT